MSSRRSAMHPLRGLEIAAHQVNEDRASLSRFRRRVVVGDDDDDVVEMIVPVHAFGRKAAFPGFGVQHQAVVVRVGGVIGPAVPRADALHRQPRCRRRQPVGPEEKPPQAPFARRRAAVALALVGDDPAAPQRHFEAKRSGMKHAARRCAGQGMNANAVEKCASVCHGLASAAGLTSQAGDAIVYLKGTHRAATYPPTPRVETSPRPCNRS